ncbi:MAG: beta-ketoacyl synthase N-terminal-like domain-containing protein, partial [Pseudomonadota bacterium]
MRRVVVTGLGLVTPLANGVEPTWRRLVEGRSGAGPIQGFDASDLPCRVACEVPREGEDAFVADQLIDRKELRRNDDFILFAMAAADEALRDAAWPPAAETEAGETARLRTGVMIGSGIGGLRYIEDTAITLHEKGPRRVSPFFIPGSLINLCSGQV